MLCHTCGIEELVPDTRDWLYWWDDHTTIIPNVTGAFCNGCNDCFTIGEEDRRLEQLKRQFRFDVVAKLRLDPNKKFLVRVSCEKNTNPDVPPDFEVLRHLWQCAVLLTPAKEGGFIVSCRDFPQLMTRGTDEMDALEQAANALDRVYAAYIKQGLAWPNSGIRQKNEHSVSPSIEMMQKIYNCIFSTDFEGDAERS